MSEAAQAPKGKKTQIEGFKVIKTDEYGCRLGELTAKMNSCLGSEPKTVVQVAKESGASEARAKQHLEYWLKEKRGLGLVLRKSAAGFFIVPRTETAPAAAAA